MNFKKVYVPQNPARRIDGKWVPIFDIALAEKYGELIVLSPPPSSVMFFPVPTVRELKDKLRMFSDDDYILAIGDPSLIATVAMIAGQRNHGRVKMLKWDRLQRSYVEVQVDTTGRPT